MLGGYKGKFLWVNLSNGKLQDEIASDELLRDFIGGYGVAARILYERQRPGVDPLGSENILAVLTGPLTGSPAPSGTRWTVAAKSPLTGTWGDSNGSGWFGSIMKSAGYDAVFFTGTSEKPVYLYIENGKAELCDASNLWGMDTYQVEDWIKEELGQNTECITIGPAGEKLSLISCIVHRKGRVAGRSGLGAVMGSKRLKAVVVKGQQPLHIANTITADKLKKKYTKQIMSGVGFSDLYRTMGTPGVIESLVEAGDSPTRNWSGVAPRDFVPQVKKIGFSCISNMGKKKCACWHCPIACWGELETEFAGRKIYAHVPEYETSAAFGSNLLNDNLQAIVAANDLCNRLGLDTISAGATLSFAFECYEKGLLNKTDTKGLILNWGDAATIIEVLEKMGRGELGLGTLLMNGVKIAAEKIGQGADQYAIHLSGQELPMHDPRFEPAMGLIYQMDATPGRHTQGTNWFWPEGLEVNAPKFGENRKEQAIRGSALKNISNLNHVMNASGICLFGYLSSRVEMLPEFLTAVTGHPYTLKDLLIVGERIANIRQAFNVREGYNPVKAGIPHRAYGFPPLNDGPTAGFSVDIETLRRAYLNEMVWTHDAAVPKREKLIELGLDDVAEDLW